MENNQKLIEEVESLYKENELSESSYCSAIKILRNEEVSSFDESFMKFDIKSLKERGKVSNELSNFFLNVAAKEAEPVKESVTSAEVNSTNSDTQAHVSTVEPTSHTRIATYSTTKFNTKSVKNSKTRFTKNLIPINKPKGFALFIFSTIIGILTTTFALNDLVYAINEECDWPLIAIPIIVLLCSIGLIAGSLIALIKDDELLGKRINFISIITIMILWTNIVFAIKLDSYIIPAAIFILGVISLIMFISTFIITDFKLNSILDTLSAILLIIICIIMYIEDIGKTVDYIFIPFAKNVSIIISLLACSSLHFIYNVLPE